MLLILKNMRVKSIIYLFWSGKLIWFVWGETSRRRYFHLINLPSRPKACWPVCGPWFGPRWRDAANASRRKQLFKQMTTQRLNLYRYHCVICLNVFAWAIRNFILFIVGQEYPAPRRHSRALRLYRGLPLRGARVRPSHPHGAIDPPQWSPGELVWRR